MKVNKEKRVPKTNETIPEHSSTEASLQFMDDRPEATAQLKLAKLANDSPQAKQLNIVQDMANNAVGKPLQLKVKSLRQRVRDKIRNGEALTAREQRYAPPAMQNNAPQAVQNLAPAAVQNHVPLAVPFVAQEEASAATAAPEIQEEKEEALVPLERKEEKDEWLSGPIDKKKKKRGNRNAKRAAKQAEKASRLISWNAPERSIPVPALNINITGEVKKFGARKHYQDGWAEACGVHGDPDLEELVIQDIVNSCKLGKLPIGEQEIDFGIKRVGAMNKGCNILYKATKTQAGLTVRIRHCGPAKKSAGSGYVI